MDIHFETLNKPSSTKCIVCKSTRINNERITVSQGSEKSIFFFKCISCESFFVQDETAIGSYAQDILLGRWKYYVEIGAGLHSIVSTLSSLQVPKGSSLLDVGCGFGFAVDYWRGEYSKEAAGLESANYGAIGKNMLGVEICSNNILEYCKQRKQQFDVIYSSEVIEHVSSPSNFLTDIKKALSKKGYCILTTPNAAVINSNSAKETTLSVLFPGQHYFVSSKQALMELCFKAGFKTVEVIEQNETLIAYISMTKLPNKADKSKTDQKYTRYLERLSYNQNSVVRGGAIFRLLREYVNQGLWGKAADTKIKLCQLTKNFYNLDIENTNISEVLMHKDSSTFYEKFPGWYGCALFYLGMYYANGNPHLFKRLKYFQEAATVLEHETKISTHGALEAKSLLENARYHYSQALMMSIFSVASSAKWTDEWGNRMHSEIRHHLKMMKELVKE